MVVLISITLTSVLVFTLERTPAGPAYFSWFGSFRPAPEGRETDAPAVPNGKGDKT
jgi:hypothetical protein